jgi:hypothetical protein
MMITFMRSPQGRTGEALGLRLTVNHFTHVVVPLVFGVIGSAFGLAPRNFRAPASLRRLALIS